MRLTAYRLAQFGIPLAADAVMAPLGPAALLGIRGVALLGAAASRPRRLPGETRL